MKDVFTLQIIINSKIVIVNYKDAPEPLMQKLYKALSRVNPEVGIKKRQGLPYRDLPKKIYMYEYAESPANNYYVMRIDRGMWETVKTTIDHYNIINRQRGKAEVKIDVSIKTVKNPVRFTPFKMTLEGYQQEAFDKSSTKRQGVLSFPPGGGKTILAAAIMSNINQRTLILTHTEPLATQWNEVLTTKAFEGLDIGLYYGGKKNTGKHVTIATVQSICELSDRSEFNMGYGCVILDECHHVPAATFRDIVGNCHAEYRYGLTASLKRKDRKEFLMTSVFGATLVELTYADIGDRVILPKVIKLEINSVNDIDEDKLYVMRAGELRLDYTKLYTWMETCSRNAIILDVVKKLFSDPESSTLMLTKRREHASLIHRELNGNNIPSGLMLGGGTEKYKKEKTGMLADARAGNLRILIGTSLADEGLDVARLNSLVLTMPSSFDELLRQRIGRISRNIDGKEVPMVIDIVDMYLPELINSWYARERLYKALNMEVITVSADDVLNNLISMETLKCNCRE